MAQTAAQRKRRQRARDRARLGDAEYKRIEAEKMRRYRASKRPPKPAQPAAAQPAAAQPAAAQPPAAQPQPQQKGRKKAAQQLIRAPVQVVKNYVPLYKSANAQPIANSSIQTYVSKFKLLYEHFTKSDLPIKLKNEIIKVLELKQYDPVYVTKELKFVKDTVKLIDELKILYPNKNSMKTYLNTVVSIIGRIKELDPIYQILAPINTGLAKKYNDDRNDNSVSVQDNQRIINFEPKNI